MTNQLDTIPVHQLANVGGGATLGLLRKGLKALPDVGLWQEAAGVRKLPYPELLRGL